MSRNNKRKIFAFDIGDASIGWAVCNKSKEKSAPPDYPTLHYEVIDVGIVRIPLSLDPKTGESKNAIRRKYRGTRVCKEHKYQRKQGLCNYLADVIESDPRLNPEYLTPDVLRHCQDENWKRVLNEVGDPWEIRAKAVKKDEDGKPNRLSLDELIRLLIHINSRRGYLNPKKQDYGDLINDKDPCAIRFLNENYETLDSSAVEKEQGDKKKANKWVNGVNEFNKAIKDSGKTVGQYQYDNGSEWKRNRDHADKYFIPFREELKKEVDRVWETQEQYFPHLPEDFIDTVKHKIFYQNPLKSQKGKIGLCKLESKGKRKIRRAARSQPLFQRFRYLQAINHLTFLNKEGETIFVRDVCPLDKINELINKLERQKDVGHDAAVNLLDLDKSTVFKIEKGGRIKKIPGNKTVVAIREIIGDKWDNFSDNERDELVNILIGYESKIAIKKKLLKDYPMLKFDEVMRLCCLSFERGYANYSIKAIRKLLPYLEEGLTVDRAVREAYGEVEDGIDLEDIVDNDGVIKFSKLLDEIPEDIGNPVVKRVFLRAVKLIVALLEEYGIPGEIHLELSRDLSRTEAEKREMTKNMEEREKDNKNIAAKIKEAMKRDPVKGDVTKWRLWEDQKHQCLGPCNNPCIQISEVLGGRYDVDHIIPRGKLAGLDKYWNRQLLCRKCNDKKKNKLFYDAWTDDQQDIIKEKLENMKKGVKDKNKLKQLEKKCKLIQAKEEEVEKIRNEFKASSMNDTRYITKKMLEYLKPLKLHYGCKTVSTNGTVVNKVSKDLGLTRLVSEDGRNKDRTRVLHHMTDAITIGMITPEIHHEATKQLKEFDHVKLPSELYPKINKEEVKTFLDKAIPYIPVQDRVTGKLHKESIASYDPDSQCLVIKKRLDSKKSGRPVFDKIYIEDYVVSKATKNRLLQILEENNNDPEVFFSENVRFNNKKGNPIRRVEVIETDLTEEVDINTRFTREDVDRIRNENEKRLIQDHLEKFNDDPKKAFNPTNRKSLKLKSVRLFQPEEKVQKWLEINRFIRKDKSGNIMGYAPIESYHHAVILLNKDEAEIRFVTMLEAARRKKTKGRNVVKTDYGDGYVFLGALFTNSTVSVKAENDKREFYRVQKFKAASGQIFLRKITAATTDNTDEERVITKTKIKDLDLQIHIRKIADLNKIREDKTICISERIDRAMNSS